MFLLPSVDNSNSRSHINIDAKLMNNISNIAELFDGGIGWSLGEGVELPVLSAPWFLLLLPTTVTTILALFRRVVVTVL